MKIVFFGTSPFGLPSLEAIQKSHHELSAVITTPDKPKGRNLKLSPSPVKEWAASKGIIAAEASKQNIFSLEESLKKIGADVFVVISFGVILPEALLKIQKTSALNVHSSLLPRYRGPAPIHWALLNGDARTGVTVMRMAQTLDTGDILLQEEMPILPEDNEKILHERLSQAGAAAILKALALLEENKALYTRQDEKLATYARKITKDDGHIQWKEPAQAIHNRVRALSGWPGTFVFLNGKRIIFLKTRLASEIPPQNSRPGQILKASAQDGIVVAAKSGALGVEQLQLEGRRPMSATQFLQGFSLKVGDILE